jgi:Na+-transporting NADH:ubiquinone oxidoreductase subunit NqrB
MFPLPCFSVPSQTADPVRVAIDLPPMLLIVMQAILPAILWQTRLSASLSLSAGTTARNLFWADPS